MFATMSVAALLVVVYCALIARHVAVVRAEIAARADDAGRPEHAGRPVDVEAAAAQGLLDGTMSRAAYRATMESVARQSGHLLRVPD